MSDRKENSLVIGVFLFSAKTAIRKHLYIGFALSSKIFPSLVKAEKEKSFVFLYFAMLDLFSYQLGEEFELVGLVSSW